MRPKMSAHEIYQYLSQKNFNLMSDKVLKEPQSSPETIWGILVFLATPIKDSKYQQVEPLIFSLLNPDTHKISLKRIKQYIMVSSVCKKISKLNGGYPIKQILKPDKENVNERINLLINANKFFQKVAKQHEANRAEIKLKKHLVQDLRKKLEYRNQEIEEVKAMKQKQKALYEQKVISIENLNKELNYKKKQKIDLLNSQQQLDSELKKKKKAGTELSYSNDDITIRISQLEREVIRNAPKLKKQRFAIIQQFENAVKSNKEQFEMWAKKVAIYQDKLRSVTGLREKSKTFRNEQRCRQLQQLSLQLAQLSNKMNFGQENKQQTCNSKKQILKTIQSLEKNKSQLQQNTSHQERQLSLHEQGYKLLKEEEQKHRASVKVIQEKNTQSISQYRALEDKIRYKRQKIRQRILQYNLRLRSMEQQIREIIEETFMQFN